MNRDQISFRRWHRGKVLALGAMVTAIALGVVAAKVIQGGTARTGSMSVALREARELRQLQGRRSPRASRPVRRPVLPAGARASFSHLEADHPGDELGVSVAPFGSAKPRQLGRLEDGHAWSTLKVPIVATVMREQGGLSPAQEADARSAVAASDNEAAARLFSSLGDTDAASAAVERTLAASHYPATVAREPPPSGAVSSWGQTEWALSDSTGFFRALACGELDLEPAQTSQIVGLMEGVIPEQQWGLGASGAAIPGAAIKGGWGPTGGESGPYLVRQAGILRSPTGKSGAVVTIGAVAASGSFEAGVDDLDVVAEWVRENVSLTAGTCAG